MVRLCAGIAGDPLNYDAGVRAMVTHEPIEHDLLNDRWLCHIGGPGDVVVYAKSLHLMEQYLDWLDNRPQRKEVLDAGSSTQGWREHRDR